MNLKNLQLKIKEISEKGTFKAYANTFNTLDAAGDRTQRGAFLASIAAHKAAGTMPRLLGQHEHQKNPIGIITDMYEDEKGLVIEGQFALKTKDGAEAYELVKMQAIDTFSIGYNTISEKAMPDGNHLIELDLKEVSLVTFPCNEESKIVSIKAFGEDEDEEKSEDEDDVEEKAFEDMSNAEKAEYFKAEAEAEEAKAAEEEAEKKAADDLEAEESKAKEVKVEAEKSANLAVDLKRTNLHYNITNTKAGQPITSTKSLELSGSAGLAIDERLNLSVIEAGQNLPSALALIETVQATSLDTHDIVTGAYSNSVKGVESDGTDIPKSGTPSFLSSYGGLVNEQTYYLISAEAMADPSIDLEAVHVKQVAKAANDKYEKEMWYGTGDTELTGQNSWHGVFTEGYDAVEGLKDDGEREFGVFQHYVHSVSVFNLHKTLTDCIDGINDEADPKSAFFMNRKTFTQIRAILQAENTDGGFRVLDITRRNGVTWEIEGYPIVFCANMTPLDFGTQDFVCAFGDIQAAYKQYVHPTITVRDEFTVDGATKVLSRQRRSGLIKDSNALKIIVMGA
jgi:HK97 family phage prohead protease/HK97 family phage major capsid protein